jgi:PAS domain S-box-containing protein
MVADFFTGAALQSYPSRVTRVPGGAGIATHAAVLDQVHVAIVATDVDARITTWNAHAAAIYGWQPDEAIGQSALELLMPDGGDGTVEAIRTSLRQRSAWRGAMRLRRRDGSLVVVFVKAAPLVDENERLAGLVGCSIDLGDPDLLGAVRGAGVPAARDGRRTRVLSPREREILGLLAHGLTGEQIAERLVLSPETIRTHIRNAREKLGASTRVEAVTKALLAHEVEV